MKASQPTPTVPLVGNDDQLEPIWIDGKRYRWKRYQNRYLSSRCLFYLIPHPEED